MLPLEGPYLWHRKLDINKIKAREMQIYSNCLKIPRADKITNIEILNRMKINKQLMCKVQLNNVHIT